MYQLCKREAAAKLYQISLSAGAEGKNKIMDRKMKKYNSKKKLQVLHTLSLSVVKKFFLSLHTQKIFKIKKEYAQEGVTVDHIEFEDSTKVLDLIEGRDGFITLLLKIYIKKLFNECFYLYIRDDKISYFAQSYIILRQTKLQPVTELYL